MMFKNIRWLEVIRRSGGVWSEGVEELGVGG
jgi:hypothetical protein